jgi:hypothetical protein
MRLTGFAVVEAALSDVSPVEKISVVEGQVIAVGQEPVSRAAVDLADARESHQVL